MGFWSRLNPFARKSSDISTLELFRQIYGSRESKTGIAINWDTVLQCTAAFACARVISEGVAQLPIGVYRNEDRRRIAVQDTRLAEILAYGPNDWQTPYEFVESLLFSAVLGRAGYALKTYSPVNGRLMELLPLPTTWVTEKRDAGWRVYFEVDLQVATAGGVRQKIVVQGKDMFRVRGPSFDGYRGLEGIRLAQEAVGLALATEAAHAALHRNGVQTTGIWSVEGNLDETQHKRLVAVLEKYKGTDNNGTPLVLDRAAKFQQLMMTGVDAQHLETRRFQIEEVCRALRVLPIMIGHADKTATYASAEQMFLAHVVHSLLPWVRRLEQSFARDLMDDQDRKSGNYVHLSVQGLMRGDAKARADFYQKAIVSGWMTRNEVRALEELDALPGLDEPLTPMNLGVGAKPSADPGNSADGQSN